ncbi:MAG: hypothetical protein NZM42_11440, partial [Gemmatales bacterium]|nr:hypothetical protein [Gemmatales bacterium]
TPATTKDLPHETPAHFVQLSQHYHRSSHSLLERQPPQPYDSLHPSAVVGERSRFGGGEESLSSVETTNR